MIATLPRRHYSAREPTAPTSVVRGQGHFPRTKSIMLGLGERTRPSADAVRRPWDQPRLLRGNTAPMRPSTSTRRPYVAQNTCHNHVAAIRDREDQPRPHWGHTGPWVMSTPLHGGLTRSMGQAMPPRRPCTPTGLATHPLRPHGVNRTGHALTGATGAHRTGHATTASVRSQGSATPPWRPHGAQGKATPPQWPSRAQSTYNTPTRRLCEAQEPATPSRRSHGAQGTGHAPTTASRSPGNQPRPTAATRGKEDG